MPNNNESNYCMFQHPFHGKESVWRATHRAYETHLDRITITLPLLSRSPAVAASFIHLLQAEMPSPSLNQQKIKEKVHKHVQTRLCFQTGSKPLSRPGQNQNEIK